MRWENTEEIVEVIDKHNEKMTAFRTALIGDIRSAQQSDARQRPLADTDRASDATKHDLTEVTRSWNRFLATFNETEIL